MAETKDYVKHVLMREIKKVIKELYGKGPEHVIVSMTDDLLVIQYYGFLRKIEVEMIKKEITNRDIILAYRKVILECAKDSVTSRIESIVDRKVNNCLFEIDMAKNFGVCLLMFS